jgi:hypothetical protein
VRPSALAKAQKVSPGTVSRWRAGECPDDLRFPSLAAFLRVGEEWLKTGAGRPEREQATSVTVSAPGAGTEAGGHRIACEGLKKDAARLDILVRLIRSYRDAGESPSPDILAEWLSIVQANSHGAGPPAR